MGNCGEKSAAWDRGIGILYGSCRMRRWANAVMCRRSGFSPVHLGIRERMSLKNFVLRVWCVDKFTKFATWKRFIVFLCGKGVLCFL